MAAGCSQGDVVGGQAPPGLEHRRAFGDVLAGAADVPSTCDRGEHTHLVPAAVELLAGDDGVEAGRDRLARVHRGEPTGAERDGV